MVDCIVELFWVVVLLLVSSEVVNLEVTVKIVVEIAPVVTSNVLVETLFPLFKLSIVKFSFE